MKHNPILQAHARRLRKQMTPAETALWAILRGRKLGGFKFRRQHPTDPHITDFCCLAAGVVVELDGDSHAGRERIDARRDGYLSQVGFVTLRFPNPDVFDRPDWVAEVILDVCKKRAVEGQRGVGGGAAPHPNPSPPGGEGLTRGVADE